MRQSTCKNYLADLYCTYIPIDRFLGLFPNEIERLEGRPVDPTNSNP